MEQRLLIIGIIALAFALASKYLKKKNLFNKTPVFVGWNISFALIAGSMVYYLMNFMATNGIEGGLSLGRTLLIITLTAAGAVYLALKAKRVDGKRLNKMYGFNMEWAETVYFAAFFAAFVMFFFAQAFQIPTGSMRNTLLERDNLFVNKIVYGLRLPFMTHKLINFKEIQRGDIVVFKFPADDKNQINCGGPQYGRDFVKRVIGLPGEIVELKNKVIYINGEPLPYDEEYALYDERQRPQLKVPFTRDQYQQLWESRTLEHALGMYITDYFGPVQVPQGMYLGIGDNRDYSCDSRFWGPIPEANIKGKAWFIHWPLDRAGKIR